MTSTVAGSCSGLVPEAWAAGVPPADLPPDDATVGDWVAFGDAQTAQLDKANGRTQDAMAIVKACERRDAEVVKALRPRPWWKVF